MECSLAIITNSRHLLFLNRAFYQMASRVVNPDPEKYRGPRGLLIDFDTL